MSRTKSMGGVDLHSRDGGTLLSRGSLTARPGGTAFPTTGASATIEEFRVALPLDTTPRLSPRSTRVFRDSAYGKAAWDRTDNTHVQAITPQVRGTPSGTHGDNLRPWMTKDWKKWQSDPAARRRQSPRSQRRLAAVDGQAKAFSAQKNGAVLEEGPLKGAGPQPYLGSQLTREWWEAHQTNIQPWKTNFASAKTPKRSETEVWGPAGRGVLDGWYTPRVSTPERLARERARQGRLLQDAMNYTHDADAAQNAEDAQDALDALDAAEKTIAQGGASVLGSAAVTFSKALGYSTEGDGVKGRVEAQKELVLEQLQAQLAPFAPPLRSAASPQQSPTNKNPTDDSPPDYELVHERYKFLQHLATKDKGIPEAVMVQLKTCARLAPKVADKLVAIKSTVNQARVPKGMLSQTTRDLENGIAGYKLYMFFKLRDRKVLGKLKRAETTLRIRCALRSHPVRYSGSLDPQLLCRLSGTGAIRRQRPQRQRRRRNKRASRSCGKKRRRQRGRQSANTRAWGATRESALKHHLNHPLQDLLQWYSHDRTHIRLRTRDTSSRSSSSRPYVHRRRLFLPQTRRCNTRQELQVKNSQCKQHCVCPRPRNPARHSRSVCVMRSTKRRAQIDLLSSNDCELQVEQPRQEHSQERARI